MVKGLVAPGTDIRRARLVEGYTGFSVSHSRLWQAGHCCGPFGWVVLGSQTWVQFGQWYSVTFLVTVVRLAVVIAVLYIFLVDCLPMLSHMLG